jgi:hypothetical protein
VFYGSSPNRVYGSTTAAHCREAFFDTANPDNRYYGRTHAISAVVNGKTIDTQMIRGGGHVQGKIWSGGRETTSTRWVRNGGNPAVNAGLYAGGWNVGDIRVRVTAVDRFVRTDEDGDGDIDPTQYGPGFTYVHQTAGECAVWSGDSGGPVFSVNGDDQSATIRGFVSIGNPPNHGVNCFENGFGIRVSTALTVGPGVGLVTQTSGNGP